jgi:dihydrofolate reductase
MNNNINLIVALCKNNGIGYENTLPWKISSDLKKFKKLTQGKGNNCIIMGKNTYESIKKSLPNRDNLILSTQLEIDKIHNENKITKSFNNLNSLHDFIKLKNYDEIWVIGGSQIYDLFLNNYINNELKVNNIYVTYIDKEYICDTFFPKIDYNTYRFMSQEIHNTENEELKYTIFDRLYIRK